MRIQDPTMHFNIQDVALPQMHLGLTVEQHNHAFYLSLRSTCTRTRRNLMLEIKDL